MAIEVKKLTDPDIRNAKPKEKKYRLFDGNGLYLEIRPDGGKYWRLKYRFGGKEKQHTLGSYVKLSLKNARIDADKAREKLRQNIDPNEEKLQNKLKKILTNSSSFEAVVNDWIINQENQWSEEHKKRNQLILKNNLLPWLKHRPITEITAPELLQVLRRTESKGTLATAHRAKQIAGQIFRFAIATGRAISDPTPSLKGALKVHVPEHMAAITDPKEVGKLLLAIDNYHGTAVVTTALLLAPLFFCRPGELRKLEWSFVNFDEARIDIPKQDTKQKTHIHVIPLSTQAISLLRQIQLLTGDGKYVFPGARSIKKPMSDGAITRALRIMGV